MSNSKKGVGINQACLHSHCTGMSVGVGLRRFATDKHVGVEPTIGWMNNGCVGMWRLRTLQTQSSNDNTCKFDHHTGWEGLLTHLPFGPDLKIGSNSVTQPMMYDSAIGAKR